MDGPVKHTETRQGYTRRLSHYRKIMVKKDWKSTVLLLPDYVTDIE